MLAHCFNPQLARDHTSLLIGQHSAFEISLLFHIFLFVFCLTILSFKIHTVYKFYFVGGLSQTRAIHSLTTLKFGFHNILSTWMFSLAESMPHDPSCCYWSYPGPAVLKVNIQSSRLDLVGVQSVHVVLYTIYKQL